MVILAGSCAKEREISSNADNVRFFEAWMKVNHPDVKEEKSGIFILEDEVGTGALVDDTKYIFITHTSTDLEGNITSTSDIDVAKQIGSYNKSYYYGPQVLRVEDKCNLYGLEMMAEDMRIGGKRKAVLPMWLLTYDRYDTLDEYKDVKTESANTIYTMEIKGMTDDIEKWELDSLSKYAKENFEITDTISKGFYYKELKECSDTTSFPEDTTIYINYIGRLTNGQVFDTTIEDTAKVHNIWVSGKTYQPQPVKWGEEANDITLGEDGSSVIPGFYKTLWEMRAHEKGVGVFYSALGYGASSTNPTIPAYSSLIFEIEIVDKTEE